MTTNEKKAACLVLWAMESVRPVGNEPVTLWNSKQDDSSDTIAYSRIRYFPEFGITLAIGWDSL